MKSKKTHTILKTSSLLLIVQWLIYLVLASGLLVPTTVVHAAACTVSPTTVYIDDNVIPSGGVYTFYEDTGNKKPAAIRNAYTGYTITNKSASNLADVWVSIDNFAGGGLRIGLAATEDGYYHLGPLANGESKQVYFFLKDAAGAGDNAALNETFNVNLYYGDPRAPISTPEQCEYQDTINVVEDDIAANPNKVFAALSTPNPPQLGGTVIMTKVGETGTIGASQIFSLTPSVFDDAVNGWPADALQLFDVSTEYWNGIVCPDTVGGVPAGAPTNTYNDVLTFNTPGTVNSCYRTIYTFKIRNTASIPTIVYPVAQISSGNQIKHTGTYPSDASLIPPIQTPENKTTVTKVVDHPSLPTGGTATYAITINNTLGTSAVTLDKIYDQLPNASVTYQIDSSTFNGAAINEANIYKSGTSLIWTMNFTVPAGQTRDLVYRTTIPNIPGTYNNSAYGKVGNAIIDTELNLSTFTPAVAPVTVGSADLSIVKTDNPDPVTVGANLTYTLLVSNGGPSAASNVSVSDPLPANVNYVSATPTQGSCSQSAGTVSCSLGTINNGSNATISIVVTPTAAAGGTTLTNTATVSTTTYDPVAGNNSSTATTAVTSADLSIVKTDNPDPVNVGQNLTFTLAVTNNGPSTATSVSVSDPLPANVTYVSATPSQGSCNQVAGTITCSLGTINNGGAATITVVVTPTVAAGGTTLSNMATVSSVVYDSIPGNNSSTQTTAVVSADVSIVKTDNPDPVLVGNNLTYTLLVHNAGPSTATGVTVSDPLPANVTFVSVSPSPQCSQAGGTVSCILGSIAPGAANDVTITIVVTPTTAAGGTTLSNNASVNTTAYDPNLGNNSSTQLTAVNPKADLAIVKTDDVDPLNVGQNLTYTLTVTNNGPSTASGVSISDPLPANVTYVSATPSQGTCSQAAGTVTCPLGSIASGSGATITIVVTPTAAAGGTTLSNTATVSATTNDPVPGNNTSTQATAVLSADVSIVKTDNPDPVNVGQNLTYTLLVHNGGPSTAGNVQVSDTLPANVTFVSVSPMPQCGQAAGVITCNLGSIASGVANDVIITITVTPTAAAGGTTLTNTATVSTTTSDSNPGNNSATETTTVPGRATLTTTKIDGLFTDADASGNASAGDTLRYVVTLTNNSAMAATGIVFNNTPDANTTLVVGSVITSQGTVVTGNTPGDTSISENVGDLASGGAFATIEFKVVIHSPIPAGTFQVRNQGIFTGINIPDTLTDDPDYPGTADPTITPLSGSLGKSIFDSNQVFTLPGVAAIGEILTYEVNLQVNPGTLSNVTLVDSLPLGMAYYSCDSIVPSTVDLATDVVGGFVSVCGNPTIAPIPASSTDEANKARKITFNLGNLTNSGAGVVTLRVRYKAVVLDAIDNQSGDTLTNNVIWYSGSTVLMTAHTDVDVAEPKLNITKSVSQSTAYPGTILTYRIKIEHTSTTSVNAYNLQVSDVIPASLTYVPGSFANVSGQPATTLNDAGAPTLVATWDGFVNNGTPSIIEFKAIFIGGSASVSNTASLSWTSLPGDVSAPQTPNNLLSHERDYDPASPADTYRDTDSIAVAKASLPATGFAPNRITPLSKQPQSRAYSDLCEMWLEIPKLGIKTSVIGIPARDGSWDISWLGSRAGYLEGTAFPTWNGNSVITGHIWNADNTPGVFIDMKKLAWGDELIIHAWNQQYVYRVEKIATIKPDALSQVIRHETLPWITLMTCSDFDERSNTYLNRILVRAVQVRIQ